MNCCGRTWTKQMKAQSLNFPVLPVILSPGCRDQTDQSAGHTNNSDINDGPSPALGQSTPNNIRSTSISGDDNFMSLVLDQSTSDNIHRTSICSDDKFETEISGDSFLTNFGDLSDMSDTESDMPVDIQGERFAMKNDKKNRNPARDYTCKSAGNCRSFKWHFSPSK